MENTVQNQSDSHTELSQELFDTAFMFEQLPSETRKALIELMRQIVVQN